jgi:hypothetical protein
MSVERVEPTVIDRSTIMNQASVGTNQLSIDTKLQVDSLYQTPYNEELVKTLVKPIPLQSLGEHLASPCTHRESERSGPVPKNEDLSRLDSNQTVVLYP